MTSTPPRRSAPRPPAILAEYQAQLADARTESARIIEEARQAADEVRPQPAGQGRGRHRRAAAAKATADIEAAKVQAVADLRGEVAALAIGAAEQVVERNLDQRDQRCPRRELHQPGRSERADGRRPHHGIRRGALRGRSGRRPTSPRSRTSCSGSPRWSKGNDELRDKLADPHIPVATRQQIVIDLLSGKAEPTTVSLVSLVVGQRPHPGVPGDRRRAASRMTAAEGNKEVAEVRSAIALTEDQKSRLAEALGKATGKQVEVKVIIDPSIKGGARRPGRRHRHRRLRPPPPRTAQERPLRHATTAPGETAHGRAHDQHRRHHRCASQEPRGLQARHGRRSGRPRARGRRRHRLASAGLPDCAVNEMLEFEDGTIGLALNLDEDSIGAVVLGEVGEHRGGPGRAGHRRDPLGARAATACSAAS